MVKAEYTCLQLVISLYTEYRSVAVVKLLFTIQSSLFQIASSSIVSLHNMYGTGNKIDCSFIMSMLGNSELLLFVRIYYADLSFGTHSTYMCIVSSCFISFQDTCKYGRLSLHLKIDKIKS